jgi:hypothetical protein
MFQDVDETLRQLLIRDIPIKNGEVDISFDQPKREWSARLNRPTLNFFLHNIHENVQLRHSQQWMTTKNDDGTVTQRRVPVRLDLHYLVTAWATEPEDEHSLLARTLMVLLRQPHLPPELLTESLEDQPKPMRMLVAQQEETLRSLADIWSTLDNEVRAGLTLIVTITVDPYLPMITPLVRSVETRVGRSQAPELMQLVEGSEPDVFWTIGGTINTDKPAEEIQLTLVERGFVIPVQENGSFAVSNLRAGEYTLELQLKGGKPKAHKISVPAPDYSLDV